MTPTHWSEADQQFMHKAIDVAWRGLYTTDPNPRVGCVLVSDGRVIADGWHERAGGPHAERNALATAGAAARGSTCYVTLEPCSHTGRTGPCADALIEAGVKRVVAAMQDPNPLVAGQGLAKLRDAGIEVDCGLLEPQARELNPGFCKRMESGLPWVRIKLAMSLDGRTALADGESKWITGPLARESVQRLRARSSAIVTGIGTVLADDPALTVRKEQWHEQRYPGEVRQPLRVILDPRLRIAPDAAVLTGPGEALVITGGESEAVKALRNKGVEVVAAPGSGSGLDLPQVLRLLAERGCNEVLVEAGSTLAGAFVSEGLFDELVLYMAPTLLGPEARPLLKLPLLASMAQRPILSISHLQQVGDDICVTLRKA